MSHQRLLTLFSLCAAVLLSFVMFPVHAFAAPSVGAPVAAPATVVAGQATTVTVTSTISSDLTNPVIATGVNLLRVDATGKTIATIGTMRDNGAGGDVAAGDGIFTLRFVTNEPAPGELRLRVSAPFMGMLKRVLSQVAVVQVVNGFHFEQSLDTGAATSVTITPAGGIIRTTSGGTTYELEFPIGALDADTTITLTPVTAIPGLPFSGGLTDAVQLAPAGLQLVRPATLRLTLPGPVDPTGLLGFVFDDAGANFEAVPVVVNGATLSLQVEHFSTAGAAQGTVQDFARQIQPLLSALPNTLPPTQVAGLVSTMAAWMVDPPGFGFQVLCTETTLCTQVFEISLQSLTNSQQQACNQAASFIQNNEPFQAMVALESVMKVAAKLVELSVLAEEAGVPGFEQQLDLSCIAGNLGNIINLAKTQALANPRAGLLLLMPDISSIAAHLSLDIVEQQGLVALREVLTTLRSRAVNESCPTDPAVGEILIDLVLNTFPDDFLDGLEVGLAVNFRDARAGCRIQINPTQASVGFGQEVQFTATTLGLSPSGVAWSVLFPTGGCTIDSQTGLFTAGQISGTFLVQATSEADQGKFKIASVTVGLLAQVSVSPSSAIVNAGGQAQFTADVTGATTSSVTWLTTDPGGTVDATGLYTAGSIPGTYTVTATSVQDPSKSAAASVTVVAQPSGQVVLVSRNSNVRAILQVQAPDFDYLEDSRQAATLSSDFGQFNESFSINHTQTTPSGPFQGSSASADSSVSQASSITVSGSHISMHGTGTAHSSATTAPINNSNVFALGTNSNGFNVQFDIVGAPVTYSITGNVSQDGVRGNLQISRSASVELFSLDGSFSINFFVNSTSTDSSSQPVSGSGTLMPGSYYLVGSAGATAASSGVSSSGNAGFSVNFTLGP